MWGEITYLFYFNGCILNKWFYPTIYQTCDYLSMLGLELIRVSKRGASGFFEFYWHRWSQVNTLRPRQNGRHFADDIFKRIFLNENIWIPMKISLKFVPKGSIHNIPALVQIMAWRRLGDKPLSEPMMVNLPTHLCVTRPQWVKAWMNNHIP